MKNIRLKKLNPVKRNLCHKQNLLNITEKQDCLKMKIFRKKKL